MNIGINVGLTPGIKELIDKNDYKFNIEHLTLMLDLSIELFNISEYLNFKKELLKTTIIDGNHNKLLEIPLWIPEDISIVRKGDNEDFIIIVAFGAEIKKFIKERKT
ncbi:MULTISPECIES: hypothetical protein [Oceanobacillus]|uniref:hypothetical protein n=1 Tax=Oceanobacillus TaxID=182709 RepID=UPI000595BC00|nr:MULTISPECIES: hypothetical protein [Oceanobacillus]